MKMSTFGMETQKWDSLLKGNGSTCGGICFDVFLVYSSLLETRGSTCSPISLHRYSSHSKMVHPYVQYKSLSPSTVSVVWRRKPGHYTKRGGLDNNTAAGPCRTLQEPYKITRSKLLLSKTSHTDSMMVAGGHNVL